MVGHPSWRNFGMSLLSALFQNLPRAIAEVRIHFLTLGLINEQRRTSAFALLIGSSALTKSSFV